MIRLLYCAAYVVWLYAREVWQTVRGRRRFRLRWRLAQMRWRRLRGGSLRVLNTGYDFGSSDSVRLPREDARTVEWFSRSTADDRWITFSGDAWEQVTVRWFTDGHEADSPTDSRP